MQTTCILGGCEGQQGATKRAAVARPNGSVTSFAWALTGSVSYHIAGDLNLDAAYRSLDLDIARRFRHLWEAYEPDRNRCFRLPDRPAVRTRRPASATPPITAAS